MKEIYNFLVNIKNKELDFNDKTFKDFNYEDKDIFYEDIKFIISMSFPELNEQFSEFLMFKPEIRNKRKLQKKWKKNLLNKYKKCLVTGNENKDLLEACHIVDLSNAEYQDKFNENNGIILEASFHKLFDRFYWCINPNTLEIELNKNKKDINLIKYEGKCVDLDINDKLLEFLNYRYQEFLKN